MQPPETFICPVTRLPIRHHPEWHKIRLGESFELSIDLIGEQILLTHSSGLPTLKSTQATLDLMAEIISQYFPDRPYVQIFDYNNITINHSMEARRIVIQKLRERKRMRGAVFYGLNPVMRVSVQVARFFHQLPFPLLIARNYPKAVELALGLLDEDLRDTLIQEEGEKIDRQTSTLIERINTSENPDETSPLPDAAPMEHTLMILEDESRHADQNTDQHRNREILTRLDEIIRRRNERARSYQQRKKQSPTD